jgi:hypothetical protein
MRGLHRISTAEEVKQLVQLWTLVHHTQLTDAEDEIVWRFTPNWQLHGKVSVSNSILWLLQRL